MKIVKCSISAMPKNFTDPLPKVTVTFEDGSEKMLFDYYPDEIYFSQDEFIGLTEKQAYDLRSKKDIDYLRG